MWQTRRYRALEVLEGVFRLVVTDGSARLLADSVVSAIGDGARVELGNISQPVYRATGGIVALDVDVTLHIAGEKNSAKFLYELSGKGQITDNGQG